MAVINVPILRGCGTDGRATKTTNQIVALTPKNIQMRANTRISFGTTFAPQRRH
jgi:hypothetical protein